MHCLAIIVLSFFIALPVFAVDCIKIVVINHGYGSKTYLLQNQCNQKLNPINFCWESMESACSCYHGAGCAVGPISPGNREVISGPGTKSAVKLRSRWCVEEDYYKNTCKSESYRPQGQASAKQPASSGTSARPEPQAATTASGGPATLRMQQTGTGKGEMKMCNYYFDNNVNDQVTCTLQGRIYQLSPRVSNMFAYGAIGQCPQQGQVECISETQKQEAARAEAEARRIEAERLARIERERIEAKEERERIEKKRKAEARRRAQEEEDEDEARNEAKDRRDQQKRQRDAEAWGQIGRNLGAAMSGGRSSSGSSYYPEGSGRSGLAELVPNKTPQKTTPRSSGSGGTQTFVK